MRKSLAFLALALFAFQARPAGNFSLTIDNIMRGPALVGYEPAGVRWSHDSQHIYFQWKLATEQLDAPMSTYTVNRDGSGLRKLTDDEIKKLPPTGEPSKDRKWTLYSQAGDVALYENATGTIRQITKTADAELNPRFLPDGKRISFTRGGNLFVMALDTGYLEQVTDIRAAPVAGATPVVAAGGGARGGRGGGGGG